MERHVNVSSGLGEVMAPQTLVTALIVSPDGTVKLDSGALHGRSELERDIEFVRQRDAVPNPQVYWVVWVAIELDASDHPVRYKGVSASELLIDPAQRVGYKSLAQSTNRITEAINGRANVTMLSPQLRAAVTQQLRTLGTQWWEPASMSLKHALEA